MRKIFPMGKTLQRRVHVMPYIPKDFKEERMTMLHNLIREYPMGDMVMQNGEGEYIPCFVKFHLKVENMLGSIYGQVHLNNSIHYLFEKSIRKGKRALITFSGPTKYISPSWHVEDADFKMPSWNYSKVYVHGVPKLIKNMPEITDPLLKTLHNEDPEWDLSMMNKKKWTYATEKMMWFEIPIQKIYGKFKLSQDTGLKNIQALVEKLETKDPIMAEYMKKYYKKFSDPKEKEKVNDDKDDFVQDWEVTN
jgi:transcriptional regulator